MRTLYLHIGIHRTATSSLQAFLRSNDVALARRGVFYPYEERRHDRLFRQIFSGLTGVAEVARDLNAAADELRPGVQSIILSDEDISMQRDLSVLAEFKEFFDVRVVIYLRRQDLWLESWYFQNIKWQWDVELSHVSFDEFLGKRDQFHWIDFDGTLANLEDLFGKQKVIPGVFEREQTPGGIYADFCSKVGIGEIEGLKVPTSRNASLSPEVSEFMRQLPLDEFPAQYRTVVSRAGVMLDAQMRQSAHQSVSQDMLIMPHDERRAVLAEFEAGNRKVAERYFGQDSLFLAHIPDADTPLAKMELPSDTQDFMERMLIPFMHNMSHTMRKKFGDPEAATPPAMVALPPELQGGWVDVMRRRVMGLLHRTAVGLGLAKGQPKAAGSRKQQRRMRNRPAKGHK